MLRNAGLEILKVLKKTETYNRLDSLANLLASGIKEAAESTGVPVFQAREGSLLSLFFAGQEVLDLKSAKNQMWKYIGGFSTAC